ncbi:MAG: phosphoribosyltransferase, partial [Actinomycetota bacterium]
MIFTDRREAGRKLGEALGKRPEALLLGIPRGGVIVASAAAPATGGTLDVIVPRKLGAPINPELGIGAVAPDGTTVLDERLVRALGVDDAYIAKEVGRQLEEIHRRVDLYRAGRGPLEVAGKDVIVVDDGIATGGTAEVALRSLKAQGASSVTLAVPVA